MQMPVHSPQNTNRLLEGRSLFAATHIDPALRSSQSASFIRTVNHQTPSQAMHSSALACIQVGPTCVSITPHADAACQPHPCYLTPPPPPLNAPEGGPPLCCVPNAHRSNRSLCHRRAVADVAIVDSHYEVVAGVSFHVQEPAPLRGRAHTQLGQLRACGIVAAADAQAACPPPRGRMCACLARQHRGCERLSGKPDDPTQLIVGKTEPKRQIDTTRCTPMHHHAVSRLSTAMCNHESCIYARSFLLHHAPRHACICPRHEYTCTANIHARDVQPPNAQRCMHLACQ